tara:strand:- start:281 stop:481 length:201 start_codon:yes stop_codon:yes gene_type:complete
MSKEEDKPRERSLDEQFKEMRASLKHQVQLRNDGERQREYRHKLLTEFAKDLNELIKLTEREPRDQ